MPFQRFNKHAARLTKEDALNIRLRWNRRTETPVTQSMLAQEYQVSINTIRNVLNGSTFQDVQLPESPEDAALRLVQSQARLSSLLTSLDEVTPIGLPLKTQEESVIEEIIRARAGEDPLGDFTRRRAKSDPQSEQKPEEKPE